MRGPGGGAAGAVEHTPRHVAALVTEAAPRQSGPLPRLPLRLLRCATCGELDGSKPVLATICALTGSGKGQQERQLVGALPAGVANLPNEASPLICVCCHPNQIADLEGDRGGIGFRLGRRGCFRLGRCGCFRLGWRF